MIGDESMYENFWGLTRKPFQNRFDSELFFGQGAFRTCLLKLQYVLDRELGAGLLVGETGVGKSSLASMIATVNPEKFTPVVQTVFPQMTPVEFLRYLATEMEAEEEEQPLHLGLDHALRRVELLMKRHTAEGRHPILLVDEAHLVSDDRLFQSLHLLLNLREKNRANFSLFLVGEPNLVPRLARMPQLNDRIEMKTLLPAMTEPMTAAYVKHRFAAAGGKRNPFTSEALTTVFELSRGICRRVNRLSDLALLVASADRQEQITADDIEAVAADIASSIAA